MNYKELMKEYDRFRIGEIDKDELAIAIGLWQRGLSLDELIKKETYKPVAVSFNSGVIGSCSSVSQVNLITDKSSKLRLRQLRQTAR